jgi:hypothetical protein
MGLRQPPSKQSPQGLLPFDFDASDDSDEVTGRARLPLPPPFEDARPKRLRVAVFNLPARLVSHARRLWARVARSLLERADLLRGRARLRTAWAA